MKDANDRLFNTSYPDLQKVNGLYLKHMFNDLFIVGGNFKKDGGGMKDEFEIIDFPGRDKYHENGELIVFIGGTHNMTANHKCDGDIKLFLDGKEVDQKGFVAEGRCCFKIFKEKDCECLLNIDGGMRNER